MTKKKETINEVEKQIINIELENSRLNREKSMLVMNKSLFLYFSFMFIAVIGFVNGYLSRGFLNGLIFMGLCVLLIGTVPYVKTMHREQEVLNRLLTELRKKL